MNSLIYPIRHSGLSLTRHSDENRNPASLAIFPDIVTSLDSDLRRNDRILTMNSLIHRARHSDENRNPETLAIFPYIVTPLDFDLRWNDSI
jgi:hypothetical protein